MRTDVYIIRKKYTNIKFTGLKERTRIFINGMSYFIYPDHLGDASIDGLILGTEKVELKSRIPLHDIYLSFSSEKKINKWQKEYDNKYGLKVEGNIYYAEINNAPRVQPKNIIFTFGSAANHHVKFPLSMLGDVKGDTIIIALQDRYHYSGTYFLLDDDGKSLSEELEKFIDKKISEYGVEEENVVFFGASKGGTAALIIYEKYVKAKCIAIVPQIDVISFLDEVYPLFSYFLKNSGIESYSVANLVLRYVREGRQIKLFYSDKDYTHHQSFFLKKELTAVSYCCKNMDHSAVAGKMMMMMNPFLSGEMLTELFEIHKIKNNLLIEASSNTIMLISCYDGQTMYKKVSECNGDKYYLPIDELYSEGLRGSTNIGVELYDGSKTCRIGKIMLHVGEQKREIFDFRSTKSNHGYQKVNNDNNDLDDQVSVLITAYKEPQYLKECLIAVHNQTYKNMEVIVVNNNDNGSFEEKFVSFIVMYMKSIFSMQINEIKTGKAGSAQIARNIALRNAKGRYVKYIDDDDELSPYAIENLVDLQKKYGVAVVFAKEFDYIDNEVIRNKNENQEYEIKGDFSYSLLSINYSQNPSTFNSLILREEILEIGGWNEEYGRHQDVELFLRLSAKNDFICGNFYIGKYRIISDKKAKLRKFLEENLVDIKISLFKDNIKQVKSWNNIEWLDTAISNNYREIATLKISSLNIKFQKFALEYINAIKGKRKEVIFLVNIEWELGGLHEYYLLISRTLKELGIGSKIIGIRKSELVKQEPTLNMEQHSALIENILSNPSNIIIGLHVNAYLELQNKINEKSLKMIFFHGDACKITPTQFYAGYHNVFVNNLSNYDKIVFLTETIQSGFKKIFPEINSSYIMTPFISKQEEEAYRKQVELVNGKHKIIFVGRLNQWDKNCFALVDIALELKVRKITDIEIHVYGSGADEEKMVEKIERYDLKNQISLHGFVEDKQKIYENSLCLINTSVTEGLPLTFLEAYEENIPVVAYNSFTAVTDIIINGKTGYIIEENDVIAYVDALINVRSGQLEEFDLHKKILKEKFSNETFKKQIVKELYL
ncbi:MAG: glycosyltransferase [Culicoidibacterales bacterium]